MTCHVVPMVLLMVFLVAVVVSEVMAEQFDGDVST
jgi:hypothetical protein